MLIMRQCEKCGREFNNTNQSHYCGDKPATIDDYIAAQDESVRPVLQKIREVIRAAAPGCKEKISYGMPTFWQGRSLIHFAAFKNHIGVYPGYISETPFEKRLSKYKTAKGTIRFPLNKPIDYELIAEITKFKVSAVSLK